MDLELSDDQVALQTELRRFLADRVDSDARHAIADLPGAIDRGLWRELAQMGIFALTQSEADGGVGLGMADATVVFEELGRAAVPGPLIGTFLAAGLGLDISSAAATGEAVVGLSPAGEPAWVEHRAALDALLTVAADAVRLVDPPANGTPVERPLDPLAPVDIVEGLGAGPVAGDGPSTATRVTRDAALLAAAMQVGLGEAAVQLATEYAKERTQFGRIIGSFQALKHLLADAHVSVEVARAAVHAAGVEIDEAEDDDQALAAATRAVEVARVVASRAADRATRTSIQVHGGMGYTWELDAHLFFKRAKVLDLGAGSPEDALELIAAAH